MRVYVVCSDQSISYSDMLLCPAPVSGFPVEAHNNACVEVVMIF